MAETTDKMTAGDWLEVLQGLPPETPIVQLMGDAPDNLVIEFNSLARGEWNGAPAVILRQSIIDTEDDPDEFDDDDDFDDELFDDDEEDEEDEFEGDTAE